MADSSLSASTRRSLANKLRSAMERGHADKARDLLFPPLSASKAADPNGADSRGDMPLSWLPRDEFVDMLLAAGADPESTRGDGRSALQVAWEFGHTGTVMRLLEAGANPMVGSSALSTTAWSMRTSDDLSVFLLACRDGRVQAVEKALAAGCSVEELSARGSTPLMCAAMSGCVELGRLLVENGAKIEAERSDGCSAAMVAALSGNRDLLKFLIESGASLGHANIVGDTLVDICQRSEGLMATLDWAAIESALGPQPAALKSAGGAKLRL